MRYLVIFYSNKRQRTVLGNVYFSYLLKSGKLEGPVRVIFITGGLRYASSGSVTHLVEKVQNNRVQV